MGEAGESGSPRLARPLQPLLGARLAGTHISVSIHPFTKCECSQPWGSFNASISGYLGIILATLNQNPQS